MARVPICVYVEQNAHVPSDMRIDSQMPDTSYVAAHSRETHFEHSFPDGSPRSLFQEISLPVASAAFHDKVEAHRNDIYVW